MSPAACGSAAASAPGWWPDPCPLLVAGAARRRPPTPGCTVRYMSPRARRTLIIAVIAQAAVSVVQFGLPAIGLEIQQKFDLGPAGFGAVCANAGDAIAANAATSTTRFISAP